MTDQRAAGLRGGCLCGAVRYTVATPALFSAHCYCLDCRKSSGTGHCTHAVAPMEAFSVTGEVRHFDKPADNGNVIRRHFCPTCGSALYSTKASGADLVFLRASSLDDPDAITPGASVYASRAPKWDPVDPDLPAFPEMPGPEQRQAMLKHK
ncbi:GFA family protein [Pelagibius sp. CAU 1746]|uniref:GFA family protein n=1 Tax=Pelagibius sp. CAU 1746 TaxID=3140370 RepID=UPI00325AB1DD